MGIRNATIKAKVAKVMEQLEKGKVEAAKSTLAKLDERMDDKKVAKPRKANKFALHVKSQYPKYKSQYPNLDAPAILKKIAADYKKN